jgi:hypothetical protein
MTKRKSHKRVVEMAQSVGPDFKPQCHKKKKMQRFKDYKFGHQKFVWILREVGDP